MGTARLRTCARLILQHRVHALARKLGLPVQREQLDQECESEELGPEPSHQLRSRPRRSARGEDVIDDEHALTLFERVLVNLEAVLSVFEIVRLADSLRRELPGLANR